MNDSDRNAKTSVDTGWNFDRAGDFLPARRGCGADSHRFAILTGSHNHH
jgi:hypothetical protein